MSPEWRAAIAALVPHPRGEHDAVRAVIEWCLAGSGDARMRHVIESADDELGATIIARALRAGRWNGRGLDDLAALLDGDRQGLAPQFLDAKRPPGRPPKTGGETYSERVEIRCTPTQRAKLDQLGGAEWVRARIDAAKAPARNE